MEHIYAILPKYFNKQSTAEENALVERWRKEHPAEFKEHKAIWSLTKNVEYIEFDSKASWNELQPLLNDSASSTAKPETKVIGIAMWKKIAVAAVFVLVSIFGINQFNNRQAEETDLFANINAEFDNGLRGVQLTAEASVVETTLKNGDKIWLNKGAVVEDMGEKDGQYAVKVRKGEAFFDVDSKGNEAPSFFVHTHSAKVAVVGTQFTVTNKKKETIIRVVEGVVEVIAPGSNIEIEVNAGEQAIVSSKGSIKRIKEFSPNFLAWKTGTFKFEATSIQKIALLLQTFYDVEIEVAEGTEGTPSGEFPVMDVNDLLESLTLASGLKLEVIESNKKYKISNQ